MYLFCWEVNDEGKARKGKVMVSGEFYGGGILRGAHSAGNFICDSISVISFS